MASRRPPGVFSRGSSLRIDATSNGLATEKIKSLLGLFGAGDKNVFNDLADGITDIFRKSVELRISKLRVSSATTYALAFVKQKERWKRDVSVTSDANSTVIDITVSFLARGVGMPDNTITRGGATVQKRRDRGKLKTAIEPFIGWGSKWSQYNELSENVFHILEYGTATFSKDPNPRVKKKGYIHGFTAMYNGHLSFATGDMVQEAVSGGVSRVMRPWLDDPGSPDPDELFDFGAGPAAHYGRVFSKKPVSAQEFRDNYRRLSEAMHGFGKIVRGSGREFNVPTSGRNLTAIELRLAELTGNRYKTVFHEGIRPKNIFRDENNNIHASDAAQIREFVSSWIGGDRNRQEVKGVTSFSNSHWNMFI